MPWHEARQEIRQLCPLQRASMKVDFARNLWCDFGLGKGGSIIDLVMLLQGCDAHEAMTHLAGNALPFHPTTPPKGKATAQSPSARCILGISEELPLHLQHYLQEERKIDLSLAKPYLRSVCYEVGGKTYTTIGFANRAGGRRNLNRLSNKDSADKAKECNQNQISIGYP